MNDSSRTFQISRSSGYFQRTQYSGLEQNYYFFKKRKKSKKRITVTWSLSIWQLCLEFMVWNSVEKKEREKVKICIKELNEGPLVFWFLFSNCLLLCTVLKRECFLVLGWHPPIFCTYFFLVYCTLPFMK